jgi:(p)ppGpp synthase/HD superfamily hydrolase
MTALEARRELGAGPLSERFDESLAYASAHHREQLRKGSRVPYLSHLMSVSALVLEHGGSEDQAIAALLHDAVEDAPTGEGKRVLEQIRKRFGETVASIVEACSDSLNETDAGKAPWPDRKRAYIDGLSDPQKKPDKALLVTAADKIHNARCIAADLRTYGPTFWSTFNAPAEDLLWYYTSVDAAIADRLPVTPIAEALHRAVDELVAAAAADRDHIRAALPSCG